MHYFQASAYFFFLLLLLFRPHVQLWNVRTEEETKMFPFPLSSFLGMGGGAGGAPSSSSSSVFPQTSPEKKISLSSKGKEEEKSISSRQLPPACQRGRRQSVASKVFLWKVLCVLKRETKCGFGPPVIDATYSGFPPKKRKAISDIWGAPP